MANILLDYTLVINSALIIKYYAGFMEPRNKKLPKNSAFVIFGAIYLLLQYFTKQILAGLPLHFASFSYILITLIVIIFLSFLFFKDEVGKQVFLGISFLAVQEICLFISFSMFNLLGNACTPILNTLLKYGAISSIENVQSLVDKFVVLQYCLQMLVYTVIGFLRYIT